MWPPLWALQLHVHFPPLDRIGDRLKWLVFAIQFNSHCQVSGSELICESYQSSKSRFFFFFFLSSHVDPPNPCYFLHKTIEYNIACLFQPWCCHNNKNRHGFRTKSAKLGMNVLAFGWNEVLTSICGFFTPFIVANMVILGGNESHYEIWLCYLLNL